MSFLNLLNNVDYYEVKCNSIECVDLVSATQSVNTLKVDNIEELTPANGIILNDNTLVNIINERTLNADVTINGVAIANNQNISNAAQINCSIVNASSQLNGNIITASISSGIRNSALSGGGNTPCNINNAGHYVRQTGEEIVANGSNVALTTVYVATFIDLTAGSIPVLSLAVPIDYEYKQINIEAAAGGNIALATSASLNLGVAGLSIKFDRAGQSISLVGYDSLWWIASSYETSIVGYPTSGIIPGVLDVVTSNIGTTGINFYDGVYYKIEDGFLELTVYAETANSTDASITKRMIIDISALGVTLDLTKNGAGLFTASSQTTHLVDTTVFSGTGASYIFSATKVEFFSTAYNTPTGGTAVLHYLSGTFRGKLL